MDLYSTKFLVTTITFSIAYIIIVSLSGAFRAWVAGLMGDDTPEHEGFLTLNPMMHISFHWLFIFSSTIIWLG